MLFLALSERSLAVFSDDTGEVIGDALNCAVSVDGNVRDQAEKTFNGAADYAEICRSSGEEVEQ